MALEQATFGGGCFWCTEAVFQQIRGVKNVLPGYAGGTTDSPSYEQVAEGNSGHAEVVRIQFDSDRVTYAELLGVFFTIHDPTTLNRQGADVGEQYRSVIFYHSPAQQATAERVLKQVARDFEQPIVTQLLPTPEFYVAEDFHHNYFKLNGHQRYCAVVVAPKVAKAREFLSHKATTRNIDFGRRDYPHLAFSSM